MPLDLDQIRRDFPVLQRQVHGKPLVYLDSAATSEKPQVMIERLRQVYAHENARVEEGHELSRQATRAFEATRQKVARLIDGENAVAVVDTRTRKLVKKIPVGHAPIQLMATPDGRFVYVANQGSGAQRDSTVSAIDVTRDSVVANMTTGRRGAGRAARPFAGQAAALAYLRCRCLLAVRVARPHSPTPGRTGAARVGPRRVHPLLAVKQRHR